LGFFFDAPWSKILTECLPIAPFFPRRGCSSLGTFFLLAVLSSSDGWPFFLVPSFSFLPDYTKSSLTPFFSVDSGRGHRPSNFGAFVRSFFAVGQAALFFPGDFPGENSLLTSPFFLVFHRRKNALIARQLQIWNSFF